MADSTHNVKIVATLDTSRINGSGSSGGGGGSGGGGSSGGNNLGAAQTGLAAASMMQMKHAVDMILPAFQAVTFRLKELNTRIQAISYMYRKTHDTIDKTDRTFKHLTEKIVKIEDEAVKATDAFKAAVSKFAEEIKQRSQSSGNSIERERRAREENTRAIRQNSRANAASAGAATGAFSGKSLKSIIGGLGLMSIGSAGAEILEMKGHSTASRAVGAATTIGGYAASGAAMGSIIPGLGTAAGALIGGIAGLVKSGLDLYKKSIQDSEDKVKKAAEAQEKYNQKLKAMRDSIAGAQNVLRQDKQEQEIRAAGEDEWQLRDLQSQYGQNIAAYKRQIIELNREIANGDINTNFEELKKQIMDVSAKMQVESNLYSQVSTQLDAVTSSAERMKEAMENVNQAFRNSLDKLDEIDTQEENLAFKRTIGTKTRQLTGTDQTLMEGRVEKYDKIVEGYDEAIDRITERFEKSTDIQDKEFFQEQLDSLIKSRQHARAMQETFRGMAEQLKSVASRFDESAKSAQSKIIEMQSEIERHNFSERVKALGSEYARSLIPEFEEKLNSAREAAYEKWRKAMTIGITPEQQKKLIAEGDESARYAKVLEQQLRELESVANSTSGATKSIKLDDPASVMTDLGKMGAYMSKQEMQLQDPQLSKLDEISKTLFDIRANTRNHVSKFL